MKKIAILFSLSAAMLAAPLSYVKANSYAPVKEALKGFEVSSECSSNVVKNALVVFGTSSTYGNNMSAYDFNVTFTPVGTSGLPITYYVPAGFYNPSSQWTFASGVYNVKIAPVSAVGVDVHVSANASSAYIPSGSSTAVTLGNVTYYDGGGNVVQMY